MREQDRERWQQKRRYSDEDLLLAEKILDEIKRGVDPRKALRSNPLSNGRGFLAKHALVAAYREKIRRGEWEDDPSLLEKIRMKPIRTLSGVTTITVLTKPHPCPGSVFCPTEEGLPQSYLSDEPGARRELNMVLIPTLRSLPLKSSA